MSLNSASDMSVSDEDFSVSIAADFRSRPLSVGSSSSASSVDRAAPVSTIPTEILRSISASSFMSDYSVSAGDVEAEVMKTLEAFGRSVDVLTVF
jgi:hypothetical protein